MADKYLPYVLMENTYSGRKSHSKIWLCSSGVNVFGTVYATTKITASFDSFYFHWSHKIFILDESRIIFMQPYLTL